MSDNINQIRVSIARCKQRIAEMNAGQRGVRSGPWIAVDGLPGAGLAFGNQLLAQEQALERFELEYLHAMIPRWGARRIIEAMEGSSDKATSTTGDQASRSSGSAGAIAGEKATT